MKKHKLESHVADVRLLVEANTLKGLFTVALEGMAELIKPGIEHQKTNTNELITITAPDRTALLIHFLSEVLTYTHVNKAVYHTINIETLSDTEMSASISGTHVDSFDEDVKAVTFHEADIQKNDEGNLSTVIIFDI